MTGNTGPTKNLCNKLRTYCTFKSEYVAEKVLFGDCLEVLRKYICFHRNYTM